MIHKVDAYALFLFLLFIAIVLAVNSYQNYLSTRRQGRLLQEIQDYVSATSLKGESAQVFEPVAMSKSRRRWAWPVVGFALLVVGGAAALSWVLPL